MTLKNPKNHFSYVSLGNPAKLNTFYRSGLSV